MLSVRRPPRSTRSVTRFPYTTRCRSVLAVERIAAVARIKRILLLILAADVEVEALIVEVAIAPGRVDTLFAGIAALRNTERTIEVEAMDFLLGDDVGHARDRVGAIGRQRTVEQHLDAVDDGVGDGVEVADVALAVISERTGNRKSTQLNFRP